MVFSAQFTISFLDKDKSSCLWPCLGPSFAALYASSFSFIPQWPETQQKVVRVDAGSFSRI